MDSNDPDQELLDREDQHSGKVYWLNVPTGYSINLETLQEQLNGRIFRNDISKEVSEDPAVFIPDIFKEDGEVVRQTSIENAELISSGGGETILANLRMDSTNTVNYRGQDILMLDNTEAQLLIFQHDGYFYLTILGKREVAEGAAGILQTEYDQLGSAINETRIMPSALHDIRRELDAGLVDTIISDYPQKEITSIQMKGEGFEDDEEYKRQRRRGQVKNHMLQTRELISGEEKTIGISRDGLVRIYSNATIGTYIRLLTEHVLPHIHRDAESSPSLTAYKRNASQNPIYVETSSGDD